MKENYTGPIFAAAFIVLGLVLIGAPLLLGHKALQPATPGLSKWNGSPVGKSGLRSGNGSDSTNASTVDSAEAITANNTAVKLMNDGKVQEAIDLLEPVVKVLPSYAPGRKNLAVAYNNLSLKQAGNAREAMDSLWRSSCLDDSEKKTGENIDQMIKYLRKDPKKFEDRLALGDAQMRAGCLYGAYCEYRAAQSIREDDTVAAKIAVVENMAKQSGNDDMNGAFFVKMAMHLGPDQEADLASADDKSVDFGPYMASLQRKIKQKWHPPDRKSSQKAQVSFTVARDGSLSNVFVSESSGDTEEDQAGVEAVHDLGKAPPLPAGAPEKVVIQFGFDYNVLDSKKNN